VICPSCLLRSPNGQKDDERSHAENESAEPDRFDGEMVKALGSNGMRHFWRQSSDGFDLDHAV
jgi:hypothetical protein